MGVGNDFGAVSDMEKMGWNVPKERIIEYL